jgi:hypothetical protein
MNWHFGSLHELLGSGSRQELAVPGRLLVGMRSALRARISQY